MSRRGTAARFGLRFSLSRWPAASGELYKDRLPLVRAVYLLGRRRAEAKSRRDLDDMADRFEALNEEVHDELRGLRNDIARLHQIGDAVEAERDERA